MGIERNNTVEAGAGEVRELDRRAGDGLDVRLLWEPADESRLDHGD